MKILLVGMASFLLAGVISVVWIALPDHEAMAAGNTYYVATSGSDSNSCSQSSPCRTIARGSSMLAAGDTLYIRGGTYDEQLDHGLGGFYWKNGTSWNNMTVYSSYPNETVIIRPSSGGIALRFENTSQYIEVNGLIIDAFNMQYSVIKIDGYDGREAKYIRIKNNEIMNAGRAFGDGNSGMGILGGGASCEFINNDIHHNENYGFYTGGSLDGSGSLYEGNRIHDNGGYGIHLYNEYGGVHNNIIRNNLFYNNGTGYFQAPGDWRTPPAMIISGGRNNAFYNNILYKNHAGLFVAYGAVDTQVFNNTIYGNTSFGLDVNGAFSGSTNARVINNIVYGNGSSQITNDATNTTLQNNLTTNPLFINPSAGGFHLQSGSPAIDAGMTLPEVPCDFDGNSRPAGSSHDIGAYEYGGTKSTNCTSGSSGGGATPTPTAPPTPTPIPKPVISLQATPTTLSIPGQSSYLLWIVQHATSCTATGAWSGTKSPTGGTEVLTPSQTSTYTLTCQGPGGSARARIVISVGASGYCHRYTNGTTIPQGFGVPWDTNNPSVTLLKAMCGAGSTTLELGDQNSLTYIYKQAYIARPGATGWTPITLLGSNQISNAWFPKNATAIVQMSDSEQRQNSYYVGYVCQYRTNAWKCGCRDSLCTQSFWQIQQVRR